jgi:hypothetical protein
MFTTTSRRSFSVEPNQHPEQAKQPEGEKPEGEKLEGEKPSEAPELLQDVPPWTFPIIIALSACLSAYVV